MPRLSYSGWTKSAQIDPSRGSAAEKPWIAPSSSQTQNVELSKSQSVSDSIKAGFEGRFSRTANRISEMRGRSARVAFRITVCSLHYSPVDHARRGCRRNSTLFVAVHKDAIGPYPKGRSFVRGPLIEVNPTCQEEARRSSH
jgi:hypothetical protein